MKKEYEVLDAKSVLRIDFFQVVQEKKKNLSSNNRIDWIFESWLNS